MAVENLVTGRRIAALHANSPHASDRALAQVVLEAWRGRERRIPIKDAAGLAVKIGLLKRGNLTWWLKHEHAVASLADALDCSIAELEIRDEPDPESRLYRFDDLPDLRPLDLRTDVVDALAEPNWFAADLFRHTRPVWIEAPSGAGKTLAARWHHARGHAAALRVDRLIDALDRLPEGPLVLEVERADSALDADALRRLAARAQLLVLAPFLPPAGENDRQPLSEWTMEPTRLLGPRSGFTCYRWRPLPAWRTAFIGWIARQQDLGEHWVKRTAEHVDALDPDQSLFDTPGALLPLLRSIWDEAPGKLRRNDFVEKWLSLTIARVAADRATWSIWLQAHGAELIAALMERRLADTSLPWSGGLTREQWAALVPPELTPRLAGEAMRRELAALVRADASRQPQAIERTASKLEQPSPEEAVQYLVNTRLLRPVGTGGFDLYPRWVAEWLARAHAARVVGPGAPAATWGRWSVDPPRRVHVDAAFDELDGPRFRDTTVAALAAWDARSLGSVGAIETLFAAVARRLRNGAVALSTSTLHELWRRQESLLRRQEGWAPEPLTRPDSRSGGWPRPEGLASFWTWSLHVPRPPERDHDDAWLVPGWSRPRLSAIPQWLASYDLRPGVARDELPGWDWLYRLARSVVEKCDDDSLPARLPDLLVPELFCAASRKGWQITRELAWVLFQSDATPAIALAAITDLPSSQQENIARAVWQAMSEGQDLSRLFQTPAVFDFVSRHLIDEDVIEAVRADKLPLFIVEPSSERFCRLPLPLWEAALREALLQSKDDHWWHSAQRWPAWTAPVLETLLDVRPPASPWMGARRLWQTSPDRALARTTAMDLEGPHAGAWIAEGWSYRRNALLDLIESRARRPLPESLRHWLARHIADTPGSGADRVFALLAENRGS